MKKKIFLFLVPLIAILVFINCKAHYDGPCHRYACGVSVSNGQQVDEHYSNFNKATTNKDKNAFRIKARDDAHAMVLPVCWNTTSEVPDHAKPYYFNYVSPTFSCQISIARLRGPPLA